MTAIFKELDNGRLFTAQQVWRNADTGLIESCVGVWEWEHAAAVISEVQPPQFPPEYGPTCSIFWMGNHLHIRAEYQAVQAAYRRYKQRYGGQYLRLLAN